MRTAPFRRGKAGDKARRGPRRISCGTGKDFDKACALRVPLSIGFILLPCSIKNHPSEGRGQAAPQVRGAPAVVFRKGGTDVSLDQAIGRLAAGDTAAFDELYNETRKTVYYIALSVVRERMLAEDVMQSAYLKVIGNAGQYRQGTNALAWIARITRNEALDLLRRRAREVSVDEHASPAMFGTQNVDEYGLLIDLARRMLKEEEFSILILSAVEGYKRREIAAMLSMPLPTVTWHYARAVKKMQRALQESEQERDKQGGYGVDRRELEKELRREAQEHTPDVYARVIASADGARAGGAAAAVAVRRRPWIAFAAVAAALVLLLACLLPVLLPRSGSADLYISINPSVQFTVRGDRVTGVKALDRDAALLLVGEDFTGMSPEDAGAAFAALSEQKHLITAQGIGVYAVGDDGEAIERRVRERLESEYSGKGYAVNELSQSDFDALVAAYDEHAMGDFEDYLERELSGLKNGFSGRVRTLMETYEDDLSAVFAGELQRAAFNTKYMYLGEDCIFEDGDESQRDLMEEFRELQAEISRYGDRYIFDELFDEFLETVEELYEQDVDDEDDDDDEDDEERRGNLF